MTRRSRTDLDRIIEQYVTLCECVLHGGIREQLIDEHIGSTCVGLPERRAHPVDVADAAGLLASPVARRLFCVIIILSVRIWA